MADDTLGALSSYRDSWKAACDPAAGPVDLEPLLGDAEALSSDVILSRVLDVLMRFQPKGSPWPLPGVRRRGPAEFVADWAAFAAMASERGMVEDQRFWRAAALVVDADGDPAWLGPSPTPKSEPCVRLGEVQWVDLAAGLGQMQRAQTDRYAAHGKRLHERFVETLKALGTGKVCGCLKGDAAAGLEALATVYERDRALARIVREASKNMQKDSKVAWLRDSSNAPPTGCRTKDQ